MHIYPRSPEDYWTFISITSPKDIKHGFGLRGYILFVQNDVYSKAQQHEASLWWQDRKVVAVDQRFFGRLLLVSKDATNVALGLTTRSKKLLVTRASLL